MGDAGTLNCMGMNTVVGTVATKSIVVGERFVAHEVYNEHSAGLVTALSSVTVVR